MAKTQKESNKKAQVARYAGFWIRFFASILDMLILGLPFILIYLLFYFLDLTSLAWMFNLVLIILVIYMDGVHGGTPGKLILGLRIINEKKQLIGIPVAILRYACKTISSIILAIGLLMVAFTDKKQGLHDKIAKTYVIYKR